jgi:AcrR family transcriptional regulator
MPKLWNDTIEAHRREVNAAILDTTAALVAKHGLLSVTMSQIAEETGIGRATLYKYFSDVESILVAWHERQIASHLQHLTEIRDRVADPNERLEAVLSAFASIQHDLRSVHATELASQMHRGGHADRGQHVMRDLIAKLVADAATAGNVRDDVSPDELADYCLHALAAARSLSSKAAVRRLVEVTLSGLGRVALPRS